MRKFLILLAILPLILCSCGGGGKNDVYIEAEPEDVISAVYEKISDKEVMKDYKTMLVNTDVDEGNEVYFLGIQGVEYEKATASEPDIQPSVYSFVIVKLKKGADYDEQRKLIEKNANKSKWVCMSAEEAYVSRYENFVAIIMGSKELCDCLEGAYLEVMSAYGR